MRLQFTGLWRHRDFTKLWAGQTVSIFGTMLTRIALPLTALLALDSSPLEQGFLQAVQAGPVLVAGLFAGVWVDRLRRRPVMIAADLARAALLFSIPAAAFAGALTMVQLYIVAAAAAAFTALFDAAYPAYLPTLVGRENIIEGNSKLTASASVAEMGGFAAAGALVQFLSGPLAMLVDAVTFVVSAFSLAWIRTPEPEPQPKELRESATREAIEGLSVVWRDPSLRALVACSTTIRLAGGAFGALYMLFAVRDLGLSPTAAGVIAGCGGLGSLAGSVLAEPALRRLGAKATLIVGFALGGAFQALVPLAHGTALRAGLFLLTAQIIGDGFYTIAFVNDVSLRQLLVPDRLLGRVSATANVLGVVAMPIGALAGGIIGQLASPRAALAVAALGLSLAAVWVVAAPIRFCRPAEAKKPSRAVLRRAPSRTRHRANRKGDRSNAKEKAPRVIFAARSLAGQRAAGGLLARSMSNISSVKKQVPFGADQDHSPAARGRAGRVRSTAFRRKLVAMVRPARLPASA